MFSFRVVSFVSFVLILNCFQAGRFRVTGKIPTACSISNPLSGELIVESSAVPISSIDIQLLRVESILAGERIVTDTSAVQTTQARIHYVRLCDHLVQLTCVFV